MKKPICFLFFLTFLSRLLFSNDSADFYMVSIAKSGTNLLQKCVEKITHKKRHYCPDVNSYFKCNLQTQFFGTHFLHDKALKKIEQNYPYSKVIVNVRDPRDILVSAAFFYSHLTYFFPANAINYKMGHTFNDTEIKERVRIYLIEGMRGRKIPTPLYDIKAACEYLQNHSNYLLVKFEDLVGNRGDGLKDNQIACIRQLMNYLELEDNLTEIETIAAEIFGGTETFRKGKIGDWKNYFDDEMKSMFKTLMGNELIYLGYEKDNNW